MSAMIYSAKKRTTLAQVEERGKRENHEEIYIPRELTEGLFSEY
jgi:hypothetical protein